MMRNNEITKSALAISVISFGGPKTKMHCIENTGTTVTRLIQRWHTNKALAKYEQQAIR